MKAFVVAVAVTYRRPRELTRLLAGLQRDPGPVGAVIVVDNGDEAGIRHLVEEMGANQVIELVYLAAENLGPGAGWKRGTEEALARFSDRMTHVMTMDDDVVIEPGVVQALLAGMERAGAGMAAPMICDEAQQLGELGVPEPVEWRTRRTIRQVRNREESIRRLGEGPLPICWCMGPCVLIARETLEKAGLHRVDFWVEGEDIEYGLRLSSRVRCVALPGVLVPHLPPPPADAAAAHRSHYVKFCCLLQNLSYIAFRLPYSRHMWRYLPGNFRRFLRTFGWSPQTFRDAAQCFWNGAVLGQPAGRESGRRLRERLAKGPIPS